MKLLMHLLFILSVSSLLAQESEARLLEHSKSALEYCNSEKLNTNIAILIDMSIHSGKQRLFVIDPQQQQILHSALVAHGCCDKQWGSDESKVNPIFSNQSGSHCSSLGKYKIGKRGYSNWGININYKLHGLQASNAAAFERYIVLHSWEEVGDLETFPDGTPEGWGCPAVSNNFMRLLDALLQKQNDSVLLWVYN